MLGSFTVARSPITSARRVEGFMLFTNPTETMSVSSVSAPQPAPQPPPLSPVRVVPPAYSSKKFENFAVPVTAVVTSAGAAPASVFVFVLVNVKLTCPFASTVPGKLAASTPPSAPVGAANVTVPVSSV